MVYDARESKIMDWAMRKIIAKLVPKAYKLTCSKCGLRTFKLISWNMSKDNKWILYYKCNCCGRRKKVTEKRRNKK